MIFSQMCSFVFRFPGGDSSTGFPGMQEVVVWLIPKNVLVIYGLPGGGGSVAPWSLIHRYSGFHGVFSSQQSGMSQDHITNHITAVRSMCIVYGVNTLPFREQMNSFLY